MSPWPNILIPYNGKKNPPLEYICVKPVSPQFFATTAGAFTHSTHNRGKNSKKKRGWKRESENHVNKDLL